MEVDDSNLNIPLVPCVKRQVPKWRSSKIPIMAVRDDILEIVELPAISRSSDNYNFI